MANTSQNDNRERGDSMDAAFLNQLAEQRRKVDFDTFDITVQQLITMVREKQIKIAPAYQRQYRWDVTRQSRFIESIFLGIPTPALFMAANEDGTWEVVDGVQRLSTLLHYAGDADARACVNLDTRLDITGLEKLTDLRGRFEDLPKSAQMAFFLRPIKVTTLSDKSDKIVRFDLFERLNTGGIALTPQEIRSCIFTGPFDSFLERMAKIDDFATVVRLPKARERDGTREEWVLRFFAFHARYREFKHSVEGFLNGYMQEATKSFDFDKSERLFKKTFKHLAAVFPDGITRDDRRSITPVNLYEGVAIGAALALAAQPRLKTRGLAKWINCEKLRAYTKEATNEPKRVVGRIEFCRDKFMGK